MNRHVNAISGRLSLRPPQRRSLEILDRITEIVPPQKGSDLIQALEIIKSEYPTLTDFEREFPSFCFALATGVGKTRLMGAFISYLYLQHGLKNFFVMAPNLTIYNKLITDFTPNTPKYVFKGIAEFTTDPPDTITGDNYDKQGRYGDLFSPVTINIFNISKINSEVRGGRSPRIKRLSEYIGQSYFNYLAELPDLVLIMDESHRYRASAGVRAINELKPVMGLELTATPFVETGKGTVQFRNVVYDYPLGQAMEDGFVKEPAVVTRKNFNPAGMQADAIERMKLEDGLRLHENVKVELETYARETDNRIVKPFLLVIARDTTHASQLIELIKSDAFFEGRYSKKVIQVDSSRTGAEEDEMVQRLLAVESNDEPTEIVVHVNMLKEGWDVTNLYTIVPLRAANARTLIEQSIGRGLRLPYGKRTGVMAVDRLNIVAHDRFQEIIDEANRDGSTIRLKQLILNPDDLKQKTMTVVVQPMIDIKLGIQTGSDSVATDKTVSNILSEFQTAQEKKIAEITKEVIHKLENQPMTLPGVSKLTDPEIQAFIVREVKEKYTPPVQAEIEFDNDKPDIEAIVAKTSELIIEQTIDIPRIIVVPKGEVNSTFKPFNLDLSSMNYQPPSEELWVQHLRTNTHEIIGLGKSGIEEERLEDYIVSGLVDFNDVAYDEHAEMLYDLAGQTLNHFLSYLSEDDVRKVLRIHQKDIARFIHSQMLSHYQEDATEYEVVVKKGFTELKQSAYTASSSDGVLNFRQAPQDKSNMAKYIFGGFSKCLYPIQKFQSDSERRLAVILDREALKWFKPAKGQFQIFYKSGADHLEYLPDFVAETSDCIYMLEPKAKNEMDDPVVLAKKEAALKWCNHASDYTITCGGKPWRYLLIPHDVIQENITIPGLASLYGN